MTQGMQAAEPYIDDLLPVHNLAALIDLADHLNGLSGSWPVRRQTSPKAPTEEKIPVEAAPAPAVMAQGGQSDLPPSNVGTG